MLGPVLTMASTERRGESQERNQMSNKLLLNQKCSEICRMSHRKLKQATALVTRKLHRNTQDDEEGFLKSSYSNGSSVANK